MTISLRKSLLSTGAAALATPRIIGRPMAETDDPVAALAAAFDGHHKEVASLAGDVKTMGKSLDQALAQIAALQVGGAGDVVHPSTTKAKAAFASFVRSGDHSVMTEFVSSQVRAVFAAMSTDSSGDGGYLVPDEVGKSIVDVQRNAQPMRRLATVVRTTSSDYSQPVGLGGASSGWVGERETRPATGNPTFAMLSFPSHEIYANPAVSQKLLDDSSIDLASYLEAQLALEFNEKEGAAFISGDGVNKPRGLLAYDTIANVSWAWGKLGFVATGVAGDISDGSHNGVDALIDVVYALRAPYRQNARWLMNSKTGAILAKLKTADDNKTYLWQPAVAAGQPPTLLGYPVEFDEGMPDVGANAFPVAFGDFQRGYLINDRMPVRVLRDPYTNKPFVHFYTTKRVGGGVLDFDAVKLLKVAAS